MSLKTQYAQLLELTRTYLLQEHRAHDLLYAEKDTYHYFRNAALKKNLSANPQAAPVPSASPSSPQQILAQQKPSALPPSKPVPPPPFQGEKSPPKAALPIEPKQESVHPLKANSPHMNNGAEPRLTDKQLAEHKTHSFVPAAPFPIETCELSEIKKIVLEKCPTVRYIDTIPSDAPFKKKASPSQDQIRQAFILSFTSDPEHLAFLHHVQFAIGTAGFDVRIIQGPSAKDASNKGTAVATNKWSALFASSQLKLILATQKDIDSTTDLKALYQTSDQEQQPTLANIPLFMLADLSAYLADPSLKALLWKSLKPLIAP